MKLVFLGSSLTIIYLMRFHPSIKFTYDKQQDTFRILFVLVPAAVLALLIHQDWSIIEVSSHSNQCMKGCLKDQFQQVFLVFTQALLEKLKGGSSSLSEESCQ